MEFKLFNKAGKKEYSEQEKEKLLDDLRRVGPAKPLGYLPIDTLVHICDVKLEEIEKELKQKGLKTIISSAKECGVTESGALYCYDEEALRQFLEKNREILESEGWPIDPELFVRYSIQFHANGKTDLFDVIADAYDDKKNPHRKRIAEEKPFIDNPQR